MRTRPALLPTLLPTLALLLAAALVGGRAAGGDAGARASGPAPLDNSSHVHDDDPDTVRAFARAQEAEAQGRPGEAIELLQGIVDRRFVDAEGRELAPEVVAVEGRSTYEGAWLVARHRLAAASEPLRRAYAARYEEPARELLRRATETLDDSFLAEAARRFLPLPEGREAALLLVDLALERGDEEAAFARLEALEDLEEVSSEGAAVLAARRAPRLAREARLLARTPQDVPAVLQHLERAALEGPRAALLDERVPHALRRLRRPATTWPTTGGAAYRAALPPALGTALWPGASLGLDEDAERRAWRQEREEPPPDRPSPWLGPRVVVGREVLFAFDGEVVHALRRADGVLLDRVSLREPGEARPLVNERSGGELPLLEGHALTLDEGPGHAPRLFVASARRLGGPRWRAERFPEEPSDAEAPQGEIVMLRWDGARLLRGWSAGNLGRDTGLPPNLALFGAPCLTHGLAWVAGTRLTEATTDQLECWLVGLDPATGQPKKQVRLGSGAPVRLKRLDEAIPSSPAAFHGRVVVSTSLGWVAAVDAEDGRPAWLYRYDRGLETGRLHRLQEADDSPRRTGFSNEPPLIAFGLAVVAPTDSNLLLGLATRPRGQARSLARWDPLDRRVSFPDMAVEAVIGAVGGDGQLPPTIVVTGKGDAEEGGGPGRVIAGLEPRLGQTRWSVEAGTGRLPATFGRAALTPREAFVPTRNGILVVDLEHGRYVTLLDRGLLPPSQAEPESRWFGSLVPLPGEGLVAINESHLTFWRKK